MNQKELALREKIISLHKKGKPTREIAYLLDITKSKSAFWVKRHKDTGSIHNKPRSGRPTALNRQELESIRKLLKSGFIEAKTEKAGFSSKQVLQLIERKTKRKYTLRHAERIMHKIGLSLITPRIGHIRKDEKAQEKFRRGFKKNFARSIWVFQS